MIYTTNVIVVFVALVGAVEAFLIVYVVQLSPLITVKSDDVSVQVQVVYQLGFVLLYGVYPSVDIIWEQVLIVPVQVVYQHPFAS